MYTLVIEVYEIVVFCHFNSSKTSTSATKKKKKKTRKGNFNQITKPPKRRKLKSVLNSTEPYSFVLPYILTTYKNLYPIRNFNIIE